MLAEAVTSHNAQLEMWRAEATEVAQAASKWKQRAVLLQQQVGRAAECILLITQGVVDARALCLCLYKRGIIRRPFAPPAAIRRGQLPLFTALL